MANEPPTGTFFRSPLATPEMAERLRRALPEFDWGLGDSDRYRTYYVRGTRADGLRLKIEPEDEPDEYYLGVHFGRMTPFPDAGWQLATARELHAQVLSLLEGVARR